MLVVDHVLLDLLADLVALGRVGLRIHVRDELVDLGVVVVPGVRRGGRGDHRVVPVVGVADHAHAVGDENHVEVVFGLVGASVLRASDVYDNANLLHLAC